MKTIYTHKGTVVRAILEFESGEKQFIEPLSDDIGGLVLDPERFRAVSNIEVPGSDRLTLTYDGSDTRPLSCKSEIARIEAFVIYPDGTTWQGSVAQEHEDVFAILWADALIQSMKNTDIVSDFYGQFDWRKIPTSLILYGSVGVAKDCGTGHACGKQCQ